MKVETKRTEPNISHRNPARFFAAFKIRFGFYSGKKTVLIFGIKLFTDKNIGLNKQASFSSI